MAFVSRNHPLATRGKLTLSELARTPLVFMKEKESKGRVEELLNELDRRGFKLSFGMECESPDAVKAAVKKGMGLGILYRDTVAADIRGHLKIIRIPELKMEGNSFIIYHKEKPLSPNARDFLALLHEWRLKNRTREG